MLNQLNCTSAFTLSSNEVLMPQAWITINKNRTKHYDVTTISSNEEKKVFLSDGAEFQIELFNPTQTVFLAKISFNGDYTSESGIVLFPGQRIYLDRYLNKNNKLKFTTYYTSNSDTCKKAIEKNGVVKISFHKEELFTSQILLNNTLINNTFTTTKPYPYEWTTIEATNNALNAISTEYHYSDRIPRCSNTSYTNKIETGRVSEGSLSKQEFTYISKNFSPSVSNSITIKLLPESQKAYTLNDIIRHRKYCSNCGKKVSPKDKYCSNCGSKL